MGLESTQNSTSEALIYEILDGQPIYCNSPIGEGRTSEEQTAKRLETFLIAVISRYLNLHLDFRRYFIGTNVRDIEASPNDRLAASLVVYEKKEEQLVPLIAIETDNCAKPTEFLSMDAYIATKTKKLLDIGVQQVIWIKLNDKLLAIFNASMRGRMNIASWNEGVELLGGFYFSIQQLLDEYPIDSESFIEDSDS